MISLLKQRRIMLAYRNVFATQDGRVVLADLCAAMEYGKRSHVPGDPCSTAFKDGCKEPIRHIKEQMSATEDDLKVMATTGQTESEIGIRGMNDDVY